MLAVLVLLLALGRRASRAWSFVAGAAMLGVIYAVVMQAGSGDIWSPYYRITTYRDDRRAP